MREDFCVFILTHGRPHQQHTLKTLRTHGFTGKVFLVIDDEDSTGDEYRRLYGDQVLMFSKEELALTTDQFDTSSDRRSALWAYNACWNFAKQLGCRFFVQVDDDYTSWLYRRIGRRTVDAERKYHGWKIHNLDKIFTAFVRIMETTSMTSIAFSQGGDHMGAEPFVTRFRRKAMNSFICDTSKPFRLRGRLNGDVNTYLALGRTGHLFFTDMYVQLNQLETQSNSGGMSETYLESGTYVKSFYSVIAAPSCVRIRLMGRNNKRLHHFINWRKAVPKILSEHVQEEVPYSKA